MYSGPALTAHIRRILWLLLAWLTIAHAEVARAAADPPPLVVTLPSNAPSGDPRNDKIWVDYYQAHVDPGVKAPAVVIVHPLGDEYHTFALMNRFGRYLAGKGISAAVMLLPYHLMRAAPNEYPAQHYLSADSAVVAQAFGQSESDIETVVTWLSERMEVDSSRIGAVGLSLGAILTHLAMGRDPRIGVGVAILGGGDMTVLDRSVLVRLDHPSRFGRLTAEDRRRLSVVDPLTYTANNRPRRVLMVEAARDLLVPPESALRLWNALERPDIYWLDTGHFAPLIASGDIERTIDEFLSTEWGLPDRPSRFSASIRPPTLKLGLVCGPSLGVTPALEWQALTLGRRPDHMALFQSDLGLGFSGPFVTLAATVHPMIDLGVALNAISGRAAPYVSFHLVL